MAVPSYNEDLTDVDLAQNKATWVAYGGGASGLDDNPDIAMQGTQCVAKQVSNADKGQYFDNTTGITLGTGDHVFTWLFCGTPGLTNTEQNKGVSIYIGTTSSNYCQYHVEGNDTYGAAGRVAKCYAVDYTVRSTNSGGRPYRTATGSPGAAPQLFGGGLVTTATVKGFNCGVDAIRYGTGAYLTAGELISAGDASDNPCTFAGFNTQNDTSNNRWGILTAVGAGYELQGRFVIGQDNTKTATLARFQAADVSVGFVDTWHAASDFTQIIIDHASTRAELTNLNLTALGTTNPGRFVVNSANPTVIITGGTWTDMGITTLRSNTTVDGLTWRGTDQITLNGATVDNALIDQNTATAAIVTDNLSDLTACEFISDGTGHAVELTSIGGGSMNWNCSDSGYAATDGSTGNETIYVNVASGTLSISVGTGYTTPTIRTAGATVNVVSGTVTLTVNTIDSSGGVVGSAQVFVKAANGTGPLPFQDSVTITRSGSTASVSHTGHGLSDNNKVLIEGADQEEYNGIKQISNTTANAYDYTVSGTPTTPATGTITSTGVVISGTSGAGTGVISDTRAYSTDQPIIGWSRKTSPNYYKSGAISGDIDSGAGLTTNAVMILDE